MREPVTPANPVWHALAAEDVLCTLKTSAEGLVEEEARSRLEDHGFNRLEEAHRRPPWKLFLDQFRSLLVLVLAAAALLAGAIGDLKDSLVILVVVSINAVLGFRQEYGAERAMAALTRMLAPQAEVRRSGLSHMEPASGLVPGDIVLLDAGDKVPADGRLIEAHGLEVDESSLTGESLPMGKHAEPLPRATIPADRANMLFMDTVVTRGRGELVVTATGMDTRIGSIAHQLGSEPARETPLQIQLDLLGKNLAAIAGVVVFLIFVAGILRGEPLVTIILTSIALAVAAIPEGLPAVVTVTLAIGMHRMARHHAIVKRLSGVETLGSTSVICSDKTGTLTLNQMTVTRGWFRNTRFTVSGTGYTEEGHIQGTDGNREPSDFEPLLLPGVLCNDSHLRGGRVVGDPTEGALLVLAGKGGLDVNPLRDRHRRVAELPFDPIRKFMATFHLDGDRVRVFVKGAPELLYDLCTLVLSGDGPRPLDPLTREELRQENQRLAQRGLRVLALAETTLPTARFDPTGDLLGYLSELTLDGLVGCLDPPRPGVREAIATCREAGIQVKMITGDQADTAQAVARQLDISGHTVTGMELDYMDDLQLARRIESIGVFARVAPEHKVRVVNALKAHGHVVAMTGDGVNDAPALHAADMGVAMGGNGTDVAREAGTMVLADDNFATIVKAVEQGRTIYDNILKFLRFQMSTNIGALLCVGVAPLLGMVLPFNAIQILWVNIIMDGPPAMALGLDPPRPGIMRAPPRDPSERILTWSRLVRLAGYGTVMAVGTLGVLSVSLEYVPGERALTLAFSTFVWFQIFNAVNVRVIRRSAFSGYLFTNGKLWLSLVGIATLQFLAVHWPPAQVVFHTRSLDLGEWLLAIGLASSILWLEELRKFQLRLRDKKTRR